jgi:hypothetical protein
MATSPPGAVLGVSLAAGGSLPMPGLDIDSVTGVSLRSLLSLEQAANMKGNAKVVRVRRLECMDGSPEA